MSNDNVLVQKVSGRWQVSVSGIVVGYVQRTPDVAWSYAPWTIVGDRTMVESSGRDRRRKRRGWDTKEGAAHELALKNSGLVVKALCASEVPDPAFVMNFLKQSAQARPSA